MNKFDVYGIGNALVDIEIEVSEDELSKNKVEKGLMTLIDEQRQKDLLEIYKEKLHEKSCGGSAANTMVALANLGAKVFYSCKVADDEMGHFYAKDLTARDVHSNLSSSLEKGVTGTCMVFITPDADRTMNTYLGITSEYSELELKENELKNSDYLYIEGYLVASPTALKAAIKARNFAIEHGVKTAITLSDPGIVAGFKDQFKKIIGDQKVDLLFCNEEEAMSFTDTPNINDAIKELTKLADKFCITTGDKGAVVYDGVKNITVETTTVKAKDTNGAGDLFAGAFMYALGEGFDFEKSASFACQCSSTLVQYFGARLNEEQLLSLKKELLK